MSVRDAAVVLGVVPRRVRSLIASGALVAQKVAGTYVLDERVVDALAARTRPAHVRAFSGRVAWGCAALADGERPNWLRHEEVSRLRSRMSSAPADRWLWLAWLRRLGAERHRFRAGPDQVIRVLADGVTVRGGVSATSLITDPVGGSLAAEVWVPDSGSLETLRREYGLLGSAAGNVVVNVAGVDGVQRLGADGDNAFRLAVAAGLLGADEARTHSAGTALLEATLAEQRWLPSSHGRASR